MNAARLWLAAALLLPAAAAAQEPRRPPPADTVRRPVADTTPRPTPADTLPRVPRDTTGRRADSTARAPLVDWTPADSVMMALLRRRGYSVVRYEAERVDFDAPSNTMRLTGTDSVRAAVQRDSTLLVAETLTYNDSTQVVAARGDTIVLRDPTRGEDLIGQVELSYDVANREGRTREFSTIANSGEDWRVEAHQAAFSSDSASGRNIMYGRDGIITSCLDPTPHYHFHARELKRVSESVIAARSVVFYVQGVPVMWLPFIFQDIRTGRRSGMLTPRLGLAELVRNSPTYRRSVENLGYYFALTDYVDAQASVDWRSSARAGPEEYPGFTRLNASLRYRWLNRFMSGSIAASRTGLSNGSKNLALSWSHNQEFSSRTRFTTSMNYVSSTQIQREVTISPIAAVATIASQANLVRKQGPLSINIGGSRRQYPGRDQVDMDFPSISIGSEPLSIGEWFVMNPTMNFATRQSMNLDATGDFAFRYVDAGAGLDSVRLKRNTRSTSFTLGTPFKIWDFQVRTGFRFNENENDFPEIRTIIDPADTTRQVQRVYERTFLSSADFDISVGLPQFFQGTYNLAPSIQASNVDPSGYLVRSERTGGEWVSQTKRLSYALSVSPTVFRLLPGVGPIERMRHAVSPTLSWSYSPATGVSDEFLAALGKRQSGYLGTLAQNRLTLQLSTNIEARMRPRDDGAGGEPAGGRGVAGPGAGARTDSTGADTTGTREANPVRNVQGGPAGEKIRLLSLQFTPLVYDFERKRQTGRSGFATERFGYTLRSDLLPGFDLGVDYSLFQGSVLSDTAKFSPYREAVRASFSINDNSAIVRGLARLFGVTPRPASERADPRDPVDPGGGLVSSGDEDNGMGATTGIRARSAVTEIPTGQGFQASFTVSSRRQRPPVGGRVVDFDPAVQCAALIGLPQYETCVFNARQNAANDVDQNPTTAGGTFFRVQPSTSVGMRTSFNLTPKWAASWSTTYDVQNSEFASQVVTLQRELHDWRAIFGFTQAPNGNFAFTFFVSLKAQPELKFDYDRQTYRPRPGSPTP